MTDRSSCGRHSGITSKLLAEARQRVDQSSCRPQRPPDRRLRQVRSFRLLKGSLIRSRQLKEAPPRRVCWTRTPPKCPVARDHPRQRCGQVSTSFPLGPPRSKAPTRQYNAGKSGPFVLRSNSFWLRVASDCEAFVEGSEGVRGSRDLMSRLIGRFFIC